MEYTDVDIRSIRHNTAFAHKFFRAAISLYVLLSSVFGSV